MRRLIDYSKNVYSQFGEDGIVERIFRTMGTSSRVCIEFGAWDGLHHSNTANLWKNGWRGILIEADRSKFVKLVESTQGYDCQCIQAFVRHTGEDILEGILRRHQLLQPIDFLSIDIDGDDYFVFESLNELKPRLIACEYNPTIPCYLRLVPEPGNFFGCSVLSLVELAESKRYRLVALTETNAFFVQEADIDRFSEYEVRLEQLASSKHLVYLITGYGGDYVASREPTYGCSHRSAQKFIQGNCYRIPPERARPLLQELVKKALRHKLDLH